MLFFNETVSLQHEAECFVLLPVLEEGVEGVSDWDDLLDDSDQWDVNVRSESNYRYPRVDVYLHIH